MWETLRQVWATSLPYIIFIIEILIAFSVIFMVGYLSAVFRHRRKATTPGFEELEIELKSLEDGINKVKDEADKLFNKAKLRRQPVQSGWKAEITSVHTTSRIRRWKESFTNLFRPKTSPEESRINSFIERLRNVQQDATKIAGQIDSIRIWFPDSETTQEPPNKNIGTAENSLERADSEQLDPVIRDINNFDKSGVSNPLPNIPITRHGNRSSQLAPDASQTHIAGRVPDASMTGDLLELFNRAVSDPLAGEQLRERYQPLRIGTVNAVERRQNPNIAAEFREATNGDFFAFPIPGKNEYAVTPRLGLTIETVSYNAGDLGRVFNYPTYDPKLYYSNYRVYRPAIFKRDGDRWELFDPGELDLGPGD